MLRGIIRKVPKPGKPPFPVPDFPLVPFVPILVILRRKKRLCDFFPGPNPPRIPDLSSCSTKIGCYTAICVSFALPPLAMRERTPNGYPLRMVCFAAGKQPPSALAAFSAALNLALALCLSRQSTSYISHSFLTFA